MMKRSVLVASLVLGVLAASPATPQGGGSAGGGYGGFGDRPDYGGPMRPRREYVPTPSDRGLRPVARPSEPLRARKNRAKRGVVR